MSIEQRTCRRCFKRLRKYPYGPGYGYDGCNLFCTLRCGFAYAVASIRAGR